MAGVWPTRLISSDSERTAPGDTPERRFLFHPFYLSIPLIPSRPDKELSSLV